MSKPIIRPVENSIAPTIINNLTNGNFKAVNPDTSLSDLDIICKRCTVFDSKSNIKVKVLMKYNGRDQIFKCGICRRVIGADRVRKVLNLNQEEYIHYEPETPIKKIVEQRANYENFEIVGNNPLPPGATDGKAIVINRRDDDND